VKRSSQRILTTHAGSLGRPNDLLTLLLAKEHGEAYDRARFDEMVRAAVFEAVRRQAECGIDIVNDCERGRSNYASYVIERLSGFQYEERPYPRRTGREGEAFPEFYKDNEPHIHNVLFGECVAPIEYVGMAELQRELTNMRDAAAQVEVEELFTTAASTTSLFGRRANKYYATEDAYRQAVADAMREEYRAIVDAGFVLQVDDPGFSTYYQAHPELSLAEVRKWMEQQVELLNYALRGIPEEQVRFHTCYSIDIGPRVYDMDLKDIVDIMLKVNAVAYSFEAANPRHEHEYHVWEDARLPAGKVLIPGVVSHTTNIVEHPELVAERIERYAKIVGREHVIAGFDCGFNASVRYQEQLEIHHTIPWLKFEALAKGAAIASGRLW
jgi:5-methyltetrahydropteroyltriglutamate--homocysteine methyltransferase